MWHLLVLLHLVAGNPPEVTIRTGRVQGTTMETINGRKFNAFWGIPYAKPPVGPNKLLAAVSNEPWTGVWNATSKPSDCLQLSWFAFNTPNEIVGSDDCLYVNVFTPKLPGDADYKPMDVLFNIHGGGFQFLAGANYGPEYILDRDIVYVSFNYRLGTLGFLGFDDDVLPGNNGLKDQNLALKWVNQNIAAFGGDPRRITITGMSAGAASGHFHLLSKQSRGLFQKAILNSGAASNPWATARNIREDSLKIAAKLGCPTDDTVKTLECLSQRPSAKIVQAVKILKVYSYWPTSPMGPVVERPGPAAFIEKRPYDIITSGEAMDVPILWTFVSDEGQFPGAEMVADKSGRLDAEWDKLMPVILELNNNVGPCSQQRMTEEVRKHYLGDKKIRENPGGFMKMLGDRYFYSGIQESAKLHAKHSQSPSWSYRFSYIPSVRSVDFFQIDDIYKGGACHGDDTHCVLRADYAPLEKNAEDRKMIKYLINVWMNFMQGSMPPTWPTLKTGLPDFTLLDIVSSDPNENLVKVETLTPGQKMWMSFALPENSAENVQNSLSHHNDL